MMAAPQQPEKHVSAGRYSARRAFCAVLGKSDDECAAYTQQLTHQPDRAQSDGILQPHAQHRLRRELCYHQIPRNSDDLHGMYAENVQRMAAHRFQKVHDGAMAAAEPHEQPDEKQACSTVQKDAQRPQRPLGQRDAVGGAGSKSAYGNECCGGQQPGKDFGRQGLVQQMLLLARKPI